MQINAIKFFGNGIKVNGMIRMRSPISRQNIASARQNKRFCARINKKPYLILMKYGRITKVFKKHLTGNIIVVYNSKMPD